MALDVRILEAEVRVKKALNVESLNGICNVNII